VPLTRRRRAGARGKAVNVYLPGDVVARLAPLKGRINVSAVCADALRFEIERIEEAERQWEAAQDWLANL
jgi:post-segregation antitoxin (ccd killing protein)